MLPPKPEFKRSVSSQAEALGLTAESCSKEALLDALDATSKELAAQQQLLEQKRSLVISSSAVEAVVRNVPQNDADLIERQRGRSQRQTMVGLRSLKSPLQEEEEQQALRWTDLEDESEVADLREEKADVHELRSVLAQSDMEVGQRLSKFVPDKDKVTVQMNFEAQHASSQAAVRASRTALRTSKVSSPSTPQPHGTENSPSGASSKLHMVCLEMVETEQRYTHDLSLIVHTFVQGLRRVAPSLIQPLVANAEQLLALHTTLSEKFDELKSTHRGTQLAEALGSELLRISPYLVMYVSYCANFMTGSELLGEAIKTNKQLARIVQETEDQITRRQIIEKGVTSHVSIFAFLIKPVQRLCQYPLLYREVVKALPPDSPSPHGAKDASQPRVTEKRRLRPRGGAAAVPASVSVRAKANYVLEVLEEVALDVNEKVRQREDGMRILGALTSRGHGDPSAVVAAVLGPAAALTLELKGHILSESIEAGAGNAYAASATESLTSRLATHVRKISVTAASTFGSGRGSYVPRPGKVFLFRDRLLLAKSSTDDDNFKMITCWPLGECTVRMQRMDAEDVSSGSSQRRRRTLLRATPVAPPPAYDAMLVVRRGDESFEFGGSEADLKRCASEIQVLQDDLSGLLLRHARRSSKNVVTDIANSSFRDSRYELAAAI